MEKLGDNNSNAIKAIVTSQSFSTLEKINKAFKFRWVQRKTKKSEQSAELSEPSSEGLRPAFTQFLQNNPLNMSDCNPPSSSNFPSSSKSTSLSNSFRLSKIDWTDSMTEDNYKDKVASTKHSKPSSEGLLSAMFIQSKMDWVESMTEDKNKDKEATNILSPVNEDDHKSH